MSTTPSTYGPAGAASRLRPVALAACLGLLVLGGCDVEWGGASVRLEEPPAPERPGDEPETSEAEPAVPLPEGPFLWAVALEAGGGARALPVARVTDAGLEALGWPERPPEGYRARFDSAQGATGRELRLLTRGGRLGSVVLEGGGRAPSPGCPTVFAVRSLVPPGVRLPSVAFAVGDGDPGAIPGPLADTASTSRMRTFGPILTERLFEEAGVERAFLARPVDLHAVGFAGDSVRGMAATYLVRDSLRAAPPPSGTSVSLFFLARFDGTAYQPAWSRIRTYDDAAGKEILLHQDWLSLPTGRVDLLRRLDAEGTGLVALRGVEAGDGRITWSEDGSCRSLDVLGARAP